MAKKDDGHKNFRTYASNALQSSMIAGLPQIVAAGNIPKKIVRSFVFLFCVSGFFYQTFTFLNLYWEYHTVVDVQVNTADKVDMPAFTFCVRNGILSSKFCQQNKNSCLTYNNMDRNSEFCKCHPRYCGLLVKRGNLTFPTEEALLNLFPKPQKDVEDLLPSSVDVMLQCHGYLFYEDINPKPCNRTTILSVRSPSNYKDRNVCFTVHSLIGQPDEVPDTILSDGYLRLTVRQNTAEYPISVPEITVQFAFHDARALFNPYVSGITMYEYKVYLVVVKKVVKRLLPEPYETKCVDYREIWKGNGGHGPLTEIDCVQACLANASLKVLGCIASGITYPSNEAYCSNKILTTEVISDSQECTKKCGPACWQEEYKLEEQGTTYGSMYCNGIWYTTPVALMNALFQNLETTTYKYNPQYEELEAFSYIGGYVGMWLGISLVAVFDFAETLVMLLKYPLAKRAARKEKKTQVKRINKY